MNMCKIIRKYKSSNITSNELSDFLIRSLVTKDGRNRKQNTVKSLPETRQKPMSLTQPYLSAQYNISSTL